MRWNRPDFMNSQCTFGVASITKHLLVSFLLNYGHTEYELGVLMV